MTPLKCLSCDVIFPEDEAGRVTESTPSEAWGVHLHTTETLLCCPTCGSIELEENDLEKYI